VKYGPSRGMHAVRVSWIERALMRHLCRRGLSRSRIAHGFGRGLTSVMEHCRGITRPCRVRCRTDADRRATSKDRRDELRAANRCICGPLNGRVSVRGTSHGSPVAGGRCQRCIDARRRSA
jgi:hypothetical protein